MITQQRLKELFNYDPATGLFTCKTSRGNKKAGDPVGHVQNGYATICVNGKNYPQSRMAWLFMTGSLPNLITHINGNNLDNRFCNLRNATLGETRRYRNKPSRSNSSGIVGVSLSNNAWRARICVEGRSLHLGYFETIAAAANARREAESKYRVS